MGLALKDLMLRSFWLTLTHLRPMLLFLQPPDVFYKKAVKISQYSEENTYVGVSF